MVLMPIFAAQVLHGGPHTLGFLMGAVGVGSLISALSMVVAPLGPRPHQNDSRSRPSSSASALSASASPRSLALHAHDARDRLRHDAGNGGQQHDPADPRGRKNARTRHELLHHGLRRHGAIRQPARRHHGPRHRRTSHRHASAVSHASSVPCGSGRGSLRFARTCAPSTNVWESFHKPICPSKKTRKVRVHSNSLRASPVRALSC